MAPRAAKTKKADVKVASEVLPKKGRGKAKAANEVEPEIEEPELIEKVASEKKPKKGKKAVERNGIEKTNGSSEDFPAKKERKMNAVVENVNEENEDSHSEKAESPAPDQVESIDSNGHVDESTKPSNKIKKTGKKEPAKKPDSKTGRGKKNGKQESVVTIQTDDAEKKPKPAAKGMDPKVQPKPEESEKTEDSDEEAKPVTATKGKKKVKAKSSDVEEALANENSEYVSNPKPTTAVKGKKKAKGKSPEVNEAHADSNENSDVESKPEPTTALKGRKKARAKSPEAETDVQETPSEPEKKVKGRKAQAKKGKAEDKPEEEPSTKKRKTNKDEKGQGDTKAEEADEIQTEPKTKAKRGQKKVTKAVKVTDQETDENGESNSKRKRKIADDKAPAEEKKKAPLKNKSATDYDQIDFTNTSTNSQGKEWNFKIASWNVDGIRAWITKGGLEYLKYEKPDILCLQEVKCSKNKLPDEAQKLPGYHAYWLCSDKDGYAGVGIYTTKLAINVQYGLQNEELDTEARIITAEYEHFYLICTYVPNAGRKLVTLPKRLEWNAEFRKHVQQLDTKKPVIICGDMNVAHNEIDLANPKTNKKNAGFTVEERSGMSDLLGDGFVDIYRKLNPEATGAYTFWTYMMGARAKNVGWRLDYFIVSERFLPSICDSVIRSQVYGSDHCPISLFLHLTTADKPKS